MTGVMPYSAARSDPQVMMALTQNKPPTALNRLNLPDPGLEPLLKGCWELSPTARPSASAFLRSLIENTALSQRPPASGAHSSVYRELDLDISPDFSWAWEYEVDSQRNTDLAAVGDTREGITEYESAEQSTSLIIPTVNTYHGERLASLPRKLAELIPRLKALKPTQELLEHGGIVRDLQFSPDGRWLATCSSYRKAMIWKVEATLLRHRVLTDPVTTFLSQVAWSPNGKYLLIRASRNVKVWVAKSGVLKQTISCEDKIEAVTWLPSGDLFACLEGSVVHIMDIQGKIKADHPFGNLDIHDVAVTPDQQKMILVATLPSSQDNLEPSKSNTENKIIGTKVECQVPVPGNARNVIISSDRYYGDGYLALISYKGAAPPELWHISAVAENPRLERLQTYTSTATADFAGPSHFGGQQDQFVICAGQKGTIYVWDRETGLLLHSLQGPQNAYNVVEKMTSVAWNSCATGRYMLASGTNHGTVQIWTTPEEELE
ncbi:hypothetical protein FRB90_003763 [Tulasnella sp. 427]|nr:hypothetical protein FRB90_003763 [Tulasnella sp. 427]